MTEDQIRKRVLKLVSETESNNVADVARSLKVSPQYLHDFLANRRKPGKKILAALGIKRMVKYEDVRE